MQMLLCVNGLNLHSKKYSSRRLSFLKTFIIWLDSTIPDFLYNYLLFYTYFDQYKVFTLYVDKQIEFTTTDVGWFRVEEKILQNACKSRKFKW